jgi:argininosuccinate synthase
LLEELNRIGAENAIGRIDLVENRFVGMKSRGCYETPGGTLIMAAHKELEALTLSKDLAHYKQKLALDYAEIVYNGLWFTPLRESLDAFFDKAGESTTGEITLRLYKGGIQPVSRKSPYSLYSLDIVSFTMGAEYDQRDARGFINLIGLPIQVRASLKKTQKKSV